MAKIGFIEVDITADISHIRAGLASASSLIRDFSLLSMGLTSGISSAFTKISTIGIRAFQIGLIGVTGVLVGATIEGANFEDAMKRVFIMVGKGAEVAGEDIMKLTERAEELGRETLFSATEAAEGMVILGRAGFDVGQIFDSIQPILELAIATNMEMAITSDMVVASLYGFGKAADEAGHLADVMATIVTGSNETMEDLSNTLSYIAPIATSVGLSLEETGSLIMMLANAGVRGSKAATGLRAAIAKMLSPTQAEQKLLDKLGISFLTSGGELRDFDKILKELGRSSVKTADIFKLFGRRAATAISVLRRMGPATFKKFTDDLVKSEGATERMAEEMRKTFIGRVKDLVASIKLLGTTIYDSYRKPLTDATFSLRNLVVAVTETIKENRTFENIVKGILGLLEQYGITFEDITSKVISFIESLTPEKIETFFDTLKERIDRARETVGEFLTLAIKGIAEELPKGIKVAIKAFEDFGKWWDGLSEKTKNFIAKITGLMAAFLWLVGGLTPIILLFITLSSIISALVHVHIAAAITKSLVYAKALMVLKGAAIGVGWALGIVGAAIAGWKIGEWIGNLKLFGDKTRTVNDIVTDWFTNMIVGWRVFAANIKVRAIAIAQSLNDYIIRPLNVIAKLQGLFIEFKPFEGLIESAREATAELKLARAAWQEVGRDIGRRGIPAVPEGGPTRITGLDIETLREEAEIEDIIHTMTGGQSELARLQEEHAAHLAEVAQLEAEGWTVVIENERKIVGKYKIMLDQLRNVTKEIKGIERETGHYIGNQLPGEVE